MSDAKVNYYEVIVDTVMTELDDSNGYAFPIKTEQGKKWIVRKGQYVKSFGQTISLKNQNKVREMYLILVNGNGVNLKDVTLFKNEVDDCGCDMMPIAKPTDLEKLKEYEKSMPYEPENENQSKHKALDKNSAYVNKKSGFDKNGIIGFLLGAAIVGGVIWWKTKDKKKAIIGAVAGAVIGMVIGYLIGRRGTKKIADVKNIEQETAKSVSDSSINEKKEHEVKDKAETQDFMQLGQEYDFTIPYPIYALNYADNTFYVAKDSEKNKIIIDSNKIVRGKLVEVKEPELFIMDMKSRKVVKVKNKKPLPFLQIGKNLFIPLALTDNKSMINKMDTIEYLKGNEGNMNEEIYVKGRYCGKKYFYLMYVPEHETMITKTYS